MKRSADTIRIAGIERESIVDGPGIRFVVFAQGCPHRCQGCHNEATHEFCGGYELNIDEIVIEVGKNPLLSGVTFSGGEPFAQPEAFYWLAVRLKETYEDMDIIAYSGYTYEELSDLKKSEPYAGKLLDTVDYLIDGPYMHEKRNLALRFKGSSNQRCIDMNATRRENELKVI